MIYLKIKEVLVGYMPLFEFLKWIWFDENVTIMAPMPYLSDSSKTFFKKKLCSASPSSLISGSLFSFFWV